MPLTGTYGPGTSAHARDQVALYESTGGVEGATLGGRPVIIVTSIGAKSGLLRKTPLMRVEHEGTYALVASMGGAPRNPEWYHNLVADPRAEVQDGAEPWDVVAREVHGEERAQWWARAVEAYAPYAEYAERTERTIPVLLLERLEGGHGDHETAETVTADGDDDPRAAEILDFWEIAKVRARVASTAAVTGPGVTGTLVPQAWSFGDNPALADELLGLVLDGSKTATSSALAEYEGTDEALPAVGELSIILDSGGHPRALLRTTDVSTVSFDRVDAAHAYAEGEGDRSLAQWRRDHETYWRRVLDGVGAGFSAGMPVLLESFELLYPRAGDRGGAPRRA